MENDDVLNVLSGLIKKHGNDFAVNLKYRTANGKLKKRYGNFVELIDQNELILFNPDKERKGVYLVDFIDQITKRR